MISFDVFKCFKLCLHSLHCISFKAIYFCAYHDQKKVVYNREHLIQISRSPIIPRLKSQIPNELKRRCCECRAGRSRERKKIFKPALPLPPLLLIRWTSISSAVAKLQTQQPSIFLGNTGDFSRISLSATFPTFQQFAKCSTRENKNLDLFYANIRDVYSPSAMQTTIWSISPLPTNPEANFEQKDCGEVVTRSWRNSVF